MPKNQPPKYPNTLTAAYWSKKKGVLAKMKGKSADTGIGNAATESQRKYSAIDWKDFDINSKVKAEINEENLKATIALRGEVATEWRKSVKPAIDALKALSKTASAAAKDLKEQKLKDAASAAGDIAKDADYLSVSLQMNGVFFEGVHRELEQNVEGIEKGLKTLREVMANTSKYLDQLLTGLAKIRKSDPPTVKLWDDVVKQQGRSVCNNIKGNPQLAKKYFAVWTSKFKGFDWNTIGFDDLDPDKLKVAVDKFAADVNREAKILQTDL